MQTIISEQIILKHVDQIKHIYAISGVGAMSCPVSSYCPGKDKTGRLNCNYTVTVLYCPLLTHGKVLSSNCPTKDVTGKVN